VEICFLFYLVWSTCLLPLTTLHQGCYRNQACVMRLLLTSFWPSAWIIPSHVFSLRSVLQLLWTLVHAKILKEERIFELFVIEFNGNFWSAKVELRSKRWRFSIWGPFKNEETSVQQTKNIALKHSAWQCVQVKPHSSINVVRNLSLKSNYSFTSYRQDIVLQT
jgi:hypothetical protein